MLTSTNPFLQAVNKAHDKCEERAQGITPCTEFLSSDALRYVEQINRQQLASIAIKNLFPALKDKTLTTMLVGVYANRSKNKIKEEKNG